MSRYDAVAQSFGDDVVTRVREAKVLVVGAGGIGCELLKTLVLSGFESITVIDLDTIDVSNLNRQFLFRQEHVGRPKSEVARETALQFNPRATIVAHHGNIKEQRFGVEFFDTFDVCLNALDNIPARRHVNRLCLAANVPLVEAGTVGHDGQIQPILKGKTRCYECTEKPTPKTYPICTIRSTPEKPIHCIVWAKEFHKLLFGASSESMMHEADVEHSTFMRHVRPPTGADAASLRAWAATLFDAVFGAEIQSKIDMGRYKGAAVPPRPLSHAALAGGEHAATAATAVADGIPDQRVLSAGELAALFVETTARVWEERAPAVGSMVFDKDDAMALDFVTAAANLRALVFGIPQKSRFDVKEMAGNIIPAVATSNAIVAGLQVLTAIRMLAGLGDKCRDVALRPTQSRKGMFLVPNGPDPPNPACFVCGSSIVRVELDMHKFTVRELAEQVLMRRLGFVAPSIVNNKGSIVYEHPDDDEEESEGEKETRIAVGARSVADAPGGGMESGQLLEVEDMSQQMSCSITIVHNAAIDEETNPEGFVMRGAVPKPREGAPGALGAGEKAGEGGDEQDNDDEDDDIVVVAAAERRPRRRDDTRKLKRGATQGEAIDMSGGKRPA